MNPKRVTLTITAEVEVGGFRHRLTSNDFTYQEVLNRPETLELTMDRLLEQLQQRLDAMRADL